jgi:DNA-binding MarR family transcriptional regulator
MTNVHEVNVEFEESAKKEHKLLSYLHNHEITSQRKIASGTGLSLATVNMLLKRAIKRGLVKIERLNRRNLRYMLTPSGMAVMTRLAYNYVTYSYRLINHLIAFVQQLVAEARSGPGTTEVVLVGGKDYLYELLTEALEREEAPFRFFAESKKLPDTLTDPLIIVWDYQVEQALKHKPYRVINVLLYL